MRGRDASPALAEAVRTAVSQVDPGVAMSSARTLETVWRDALGSQRANVRLLQAFGNVVLIHCAIGAYGVAALAARTRRRELAIRTALGASRRDLTAAMLRRELWPIALGLAVGLTIYAVSASILAIVAGAATYVPARRASRTSPLESLQG